MKRSLSILLPVHNVQATLASQIAQILEVVGELTDRFDVLIIDDGSSDHTVEVAHDLAVRYPQVELMRYNRQLGFQHAVKTGLKRSTGEVVLAYCGCQDPLRLDLVDIRRLWNSRDDARQGPAGDSAEADVHGGWITLKTGDVPTSDLSVQHLRADQQIAPRPRRPNFLAKLRDFALGE